MKNSEGTGPPSKKQKFAEGPHNTANTKGKCVLRNILGSVIQDIFWHKAFKNGNHEYMGS